MLLEVNNVHCVCAWSWDIPSNVNTKNNITYDDDVCGICRVSYNGTCPKCKIPGEKCPLVVGECSHNFHLHCITKWLLTPTSKGLCPMCRQFFSLRPDIDINKPQIEYFIKLGKGANPDNGDVIGAGVDTVIVEEDNDGDFIIEEDVLVADEEADDQGRNQRVSIEEEDDEEYEYGDGSDDVRYSSYEGYEDNILM
ncbi:anaphase promoting complex subunit 11 SCDLUD_005129 [Saccharomycodes ludwigii]|uniref:anaphase promoting complex subunit 11 n=1 Tax=Saccharomycodes ludwigii TaxID=36035 RepID=UPI001E86C16B|nr:hypothetical protein SCDLUD_005129 [Saccharomycodes ludwigii]KAH3898792.1 hypothetical protein SCDLUD_005129 [Saccharomycodes ludwigii]